MWEQVRSNQIRSIILVIVMGIVLLLLGYFLGLLFFGDGLPGLFIAIIVWAIMNLVAYFQGDSILLSVSGARKISEQDHSRLFHVVEEMKIASGMSRMPDIYIIDDPALNAFATGRSQDKASVAITSGLLNRLNRDELQGVIGHEMSHINNRDVLFMTLASILLGTIVILAWYASRFAFFSGMGGGNRRRSSSGGGGGGAQLIILLIAIALVILAPIMAQLLYFAISRRREYLADASSAIYTRYPEGLASALEKLATSDVKVKNANKATAPLYIINPFQKKGLSVNDLLSTHPPIAERVRILRSMSGASFMDYERAYEATKGGGKAIPASALANATPVALRQSTPEKDDEAPDKVARVRETSNLMWKMNNYKTITCENCGTRMRLPPSYNEKSVRCPHCGHINPAE